MGIASLKLKQEEAIPNPLEPPVMGIENQEEEILSFHDGKDTVVSLPTGYVESLILYALLPLIFNKIRGKLNRL